MKNYTFSPTSNPELDRVVDSEGDWRFYFHKPTKTYLRAVNAILDEGFAKGRRFYEYLKNISAEEADRKLKAAGDRGDAVHQAINQALTNGRLPRTALVLAEDNKTERHLTNDEWDVLLTWAEFWNRHNAKVVMKEQAVFNLQKGYAGTLDAIIVLQKNCEVKTCRCDGLIGLQVLVDWKSSGAIYNSYGPQVAAYKDCLETPMPYTAVVRLGTSHKTTGGYEFQPYDVEETKKHFNEFLAAITISSSEHKPFNEADIVDIPEIIELNKVQEKVEVPIVGTVNSKTEKVTFKRKLKKSVKKLKSKK